MGGRGRGDGVVVARARTALAASFGVVLVTLLVAATGSLPAAGSPSHLKGPISASAMASASASVSRSGVADSGPPVRVLLVGDSTALTLGEGLGEPSTERRYDYVLSDDGIVGCGVAEGPAVDVMGQEVQVGPPCNGSLPAPDAPVSEQPWPVQWQHDLAVTHPNVVALLAGRWEVLNRVYEGKWTNILHPKFAAYLRRQLELASNLVTASGAHLVFLTAPCTNEAPQPDGAPWPEESPARLAAYNKLVRGVAAEHPGLDSVADLGGAACPRGRYSNTLDDVTIRTVDDGIHFSPEGGAILAPYVMPEIVAAGRAQAAAVGT